ncbi:zyxin [Syngnathus scovelli]|uniref:zyxin n=1 Tax=Syngnathus scovelli TaxID=161590 RepID=UPI00210FB9E0|nr:zyxin [Syngnathus scovelli]XP_049587537.1 zyxin [Syngnathus scovelli]
MMESSSSSKPVMVTSSLNFKVTTPSFYNQPKKFASVAPPRPKSITPPSGPSPTPVGMGMIGRVGDMPPPPPSLCDDFPPPPPPPPMEDELPAPPPEFQITPLASDGPPPAFPAPPPVAEDLPLPAAPDETACLMSVPAPPPPPPPPAPTVGHPQKTIVKQSSLDRQIDSLTNMLSEMETQGPFNPKLPNQYSTGPSPKPVGPPPTAPKPSLSFLPPPEMGDRPPPAPWAEELKARTNRQANHNSPPPPVAKSPFGAKITTSSSSLAKKLNQNLNQSPYSGNGLQKTSPAKVTGTFPPVPVSPPAPAAPPNNMTANYTKSPQFVSQNQNPPAAVPAPQTKTMASPSASSFNQPMKSPPAATPSSPPGPVSIKGGGVPLNMREVEELEKMTKDFIKNMDNHPPVGPAPLTDVCGKCGEALSRTQPAVRAMEKLFHSNCFCCITCRRPLQGMQFYDRDGAPECEECYMNSLAVCSRCGERITDRVLKAVGQCFHSHCFRCSTCSCILEGAPFITDDNNNPYCVQDYHRRFSPLCVSCNEPIIPAPGSEETVRVIALDKNFHLKCYRCEDCARPLSIEADENGCYPLDGRILCMKCHAKRAN